MGKTEVVRQKRADRKEIAQRAILGRSQAAGVAEDKSLEFKFPSLESLPRDSGGIGVGKIKT
jgi:hypothetical protein